MGNKRLPAQRLRKGGAVFPRGFVSAGVSCGLKPGGKKDMAVLFSPLRASLAAVFTTNRIQAAPVQVSRAVAQKGYCRAVVVNSGSANAATGRRGLRDAREMAARTAAALGISPEETAVCSTGRIGVYLPMDKIRSGIDKAAEAVKKGGNRYAARAILTTDTRPKEAALELEGTKVRVGGMAKGAGMIFPSFKPQATMLAFLTTDAAVELETLKNALNAAVEESFNRITVDGDTSTNDTVLLMANGASGVKIPSVGRRFDRFRDGVFTVCLALAKMIAADGEGATKMLEIEVKGALNDSQARQAAAAVANSNLFKCALYGSSPNWGRALAALGYSGAVIDPERIRARLGGIEIVRGGLLTKVSDAAIKAKLNKKEVSLAVDLGLGRGFCRYYTCDFSPEYVAINKD